MEEFKKMIRHDILEEVFFQNISVWSFLNPMSLIRGQWPSIKNPSHWNNGGSHKRVIKIVIQTQTKRVKVVSIFKGIIWFRWTISRGGISHWNTMGYLIFSQSIITNGTLQRRREWSGIKGRNKRFLSFRHAWCQIMGRF